MSLFYQFILEVQPILEFHVQAWTNLIHRPIGHATNRCAKPKRVLITKQLKILLFVLYYLNRTYGFHLECISIERFWNKAYLVWGSCVNFAWISKMKSSTSQKIIFILHGHSSKGWQQNHPSNLFARIANGYLLLAKLNYFCKKLHRRCFRGPGYISDLF